MENNWIIYADFTLINSNRDVPRGRLLYIVRITESLESSRNPLHRGTLFTLKSSADNEWVVVPGITYTLFICSGKLISPIHVPILDIKLFTNQLTAENTSR